jgi:hypothetical protein
MPSDRSKVDDYSSLLLRDKEPLALLGRVLSIDGVGDVSVDDKGANGLVVSVGEEISESIRGGSSSSLSAGKRVDYGGSR